MILKNHEPPLCIHPFRRQSNNMSVAIQFWSLLKGSEPSAINSLYQGGWVTKYDLGGQMEVREAASDRRDGVLMPRRGCEGLDGRVPFSRSALCRRKAKK